MLRRLLVAQSSSNLVDKLSSCTIPSAKVLTFIFPSVRSVCSMVSHTIASDAIVLEAAVADEVSRIRASNYPSTIATLHVNDKKLILDKGDGDGSTGSSKDFSGEDNGSHNGQGSDGGSSSIFSSTAENGTENNTSTSSAFTPFIMKSMKPRQLMTELDKHIVGQSDAKKAVAIALRNRWRRHKVLCQEMQEEISPKNILMIGPTGVGKSEIARRLAKLVDAPFVKVEATKFTEVGFHGRDVDSIIEDLYKTALNQTKQLLMKHHQGAAKQRAEDRILNALAGAAGSFKDHLRSGALDNLEIMIDIQERKEPPKSTVAGPEGVMISVDIPAMMGFGSGSKQPRTVKKNLKIKDAMPLVLQEELEKMVETADVQKEALRACEEDGIVVIDEIDKIVTSSGGYKGHQASAEGVQQDLLPLIEGTTITTKGNVQIKTDKILFIGSGAFHSVKVNDMLAELQGRLPIRVQLKPLTTDDFYRIVTEPKFNLIAQHTAMLATEGVALEFTNEAKWEIARIAAHVNSTVQNIGARRLITITEKVLEEISFDAPDKQGETVTIDIEYVKKAVQPLVSKVDISRYLL